MSTKYSGRALRGIAPRLFQNQVFSQQLGAGQREQQNQGESEAGPEGDFGTRPHRPLDEPRRPADSVEDRRGHADLPRRFSNGQVGGSLQVRRADSCGGPSQSLATPPGLRQSGPDPLGDPRALELRQGSQDVEL